MTRMIGKTISHYRILGQVGEGGMGVVYVAEDLHLGRRVAVKIPHAGRDEKHYRARFLREARSVSKLRHPNIAAVHDFGETDDGQPFIVMELVSGETLGDVLTKTGLSVARAVEVARQTADALSEAHRRGVVHRDIKPSNVLIDENGEVKVLDFGLAKQLHEEGGGAGGADAQTLLSARTRSDVVIGTPLYLSPEQARGARVDGRSDLFALGALLYECLAGRPAFSGANVIEIGAQVLHFDPPPPSRLNPRVTAELDRATLKALAKKPEDRFQTAAEFAAELARVRSRLPDSDTATTRRLAGAEHTARSSALITMAEAVRRPKFSLLTVLGAAALVVVGFLAFAYFRRPAAHRPSPEVAGLYEGGVAAMREGAYYRASGLLAQAVEREPGFALARARLAEAWMEMDFLDRAKDEMIAVSRRVPDFGVFPRADALSLEALHATLGREHAAAIAGHQEIVRLDPKSPQAHLDLGRAYERDNQIEKAVKSYTEATTLDNSYAAAFLRLGALHARQGNQPGAGAALERAERLYAERGGGKEGEAATRYQRGRFLLSVQQKPREAQAEFERAHHLARETRNAYQEVQALIQLGLTLNDENAALANAREALTLAQSNGMNDQVANAQLTIGLILFSKLGKNDEARQNYEQALQYARSSKLKRYEALAISNIGSLLYQLGRFDEAEPYVEQARDYFLQGGYRRESQQCVVLIARIKKRRGDHAGAFALFDEQLKAAERAGDMGQIGALHNECGFLFQAQEKYPEALKHLREGEAVARAIHNQLLLNYSLLNQAHVLWPLSRYDEAAGLYARLSTPGAPGVSKNMLVLIRLAEAEMEVSRRRFPEAARKAREALALLNEEKSPPKDSLALADGVLGLAESFRGSAARGRALCEGAALLASEAGNQSVAARLQLWLAMALLAAGDAAGARTAALGARDSFARLGRADSEWQALAVAGKAGRLAGDPAAASEHLARAAEALARLEQSLGADAAGYLSRPDVKTLRGELTAVDTAGAAH